MRAAAVERYWTFARRRHPRRAMPFLPAGSYVCDGCCQVNGGDWGRPPAPPYAGPSSTTFCSLGCQAAALGPATGGTPAASAAPPARLAGRQKRAAAVAPYAARAAGERPY